MCFFSLFSKTERERLYLASGRWSGFTSVFTEVVPNTLHLFRQGIFIAEHLVSFYQLPCIFLLRTGPNTTGMWMGGARLAGKSSLKSCFSQRMLSARRFHGGACSMWHTIRQRCWNADSELRLETATCFKRRHLAGCCQAHSNWGTEKHCDGIQFDNAEHHHFIIIDFRFQQDLKLPSFLFFFHAD